MLSELLDSLKDEKKASLAVADPKLGNAISKLPQLSISPIADSSTADVYRAIREHLPSLIPGLLPEDINTMSLGLSHSLSRHKLKFSPDKVDTMIIQAIALLDDLDKELNTYAMRVKEWYGWHFPELARIINDNVAYARFILTTGMRSNTSSTDLSDVLPEEIEAAVKAAAEISMGTEITSEDLENIQSLAEQVVALTEYRAQLSSYLSTRMQAIAPNLTALVGELVGARLIAHAGSLMNLAKSPGSTLQILGAEKALFRALKTKHDTPKYGIIFHASLIGQATGRNKGKIARMLASKAALGVRVDSLSEWGVGGKGTDKEPTEEEKSYVGVRARAAIENRLRVLEGKPITKVATQIAPPTAAGGKKWEIKEAKKYNKDADGLTGEEPAATDAGAEPPKKLAQAAHEDEDEDEDEDSDDSDDEDEEEEEQPKKKANGEKKPSKDDKQKLKEEKRKRKEERAAKRAKKEEKKAAKAAKKAAKAAKLNGDVDSKKRKREDAEEKSEKKKKKSKKDA